MNCNYNKYKYYKYLFFTEGYQMYREIKINSLEEVFQLLNERSFEDNKKRYFIGTAMKNKLI